MAECVMVNTDYYLGISNVYGLGFLEFSQNLGNKEHGIYCIMHQLTKARPYAISLPRKVLWCSITPPYLIYLVPRDFWLFTKLKLARKGKCFYIISDIQNALTVILEQFWTTSFRSAPKNCTTASTTVLTHKEFNLSKT